MGFGQGLSGLNAASQNLDVIGNNIANANTVGFKAAGVSFADVYASSRVGLGVNVAAVNQRFIVGNISNTGGQFDIAIDSNNGFFRVVDSGGTVLYTRNGEFQLDKSNHIVNNQGYQLTGYPAGGVGGDPIPIVVDRGSIQPQATTNAFMIINLNANAPVIDPATTPFDPLVPSTYTNVQPMTVYDSLGNTHQLNQYFVKGPGAGTNSVYNVYYTLDGVTLDTPAAGASGFSTTQLEFDQGGALVTPASGKVDLAFNSPGGVDSPAFQLNFTMDYTGSTQFGSGVSLTKDQNGFSSGEYTNVAIAKDGSILAQYSNGESKVIGTIALANFNNLQGLRPVGNNAWSETSESGQAVLGQPGTAGLGNLIGQALESSNVDMSRELVNMIIAQRTYQANAQTIQTQSDILQTLLQIR